MMSEKEHQQLIKEIDNAYLKIYLLDIIQKSFLRGLSHERYKPEENQQFMMNLAEAEKQKILKDKRFKYLT